MTQINNLSRRKFIIGGGCMCGASLLLSSCTEVALSERKQLNIMSDDFLYSRTFPAYNNFKSQSKLITGTFEYNQIVDIGFKTRDAINVYYETKPGTYTYSYLDHNNESHPQPGELPYIDIVAEPGTAASLFKDGENGSDLYIDFWLLSDGAVIQNFNYKTVPSETDSPN